MQGHMGIYSARNRNKGKTDTRDLIGVSMGQAGQFSSVQFSHAVVSDSATPWIAARQVSLSITNSQSSPKLMSMESMMPSSHLILCHPLLLLPPIPPSIKVFSNDSTLRMRWPKYWSFSFSIIPSEEHPGLISFRMDWLDLLAVQGTLKRINEVNQCFVYLLTIAYFLWWNVHLTLLHIFYWVAYLTGLDCLLYILDASPLSGI